MKEQEEKHTLGDDSQDQKDSMIDNKPEELYQADLKRPKENKPSRQQESDQKKIEDIIDQCRPPLPDDIILACLKDSFDEEGLRDLCLRFKELDDELKDSDRVNEIRRRLIRYCNRHSTWDLLWDYIRRDNNTKYKEFFPKWQKAKKAFRTPADDFIYASESPIQKKTLSPDDVAKDHPLSGDNVAAVSNWFHTELDSQEKSIVLAVALFKGINRKYIATIADEIQNRLFETT